MKEFKITISEEELQPIKNISDYYLNKEYELIHNDFIFFKTENKDYTIEKLETFLQSEDAILRRWAFSMLSHKLWYYQNLADKYNCELLTTFKN